MKKFVILTDSCCDLDKSMREKYEIEYLPMQIAYDDKSFFASLDWEEISAKKFYDMLRQGVQFRSSQINIEAFYNEYEKYIKMGYDVLSMSTSSGLSGSINSSLVAKNNIKEEYPDANIICVDCLRGSLGQGLLLMHASEMRAAGKTIEEVAAWVEENRSKVHQIGSVDDLKYLKRAGRVTGAAALMSDIFRIKPLLISNTKGQNVSIGKTIGRKSSLRKCINYVKENIIDPQNQIIGIVHADCLDEAKKLKATLLEEVGCKDVYINYVGATIGASVGPGMFGIYFFGKEVTK